MGFHCPKEILEEILKDLDAMSLSGDPSEAGTVSARASGIALEWTSGPSVPTSGVPPGDFYLEDHDPEVMEYDIQTGPGADAVRASTWVRCVRRIGLRLGWWQLLRMTFGSPPRTPGLGAAHQ